jgi:hypothetical protein
LAIPLILRTPLLDLEKKKKPKQTHNKKKNLLWRHLLRTWGANFFITSRKKRKSKRKTTGMDNKVFGTLLGGTASGVLFGIFSYKGGGARPTVVTDQMSLKTMTITKFFLSSVMTGGISIAALNAAGSLPLSTNTTRKTKKKKKSLFVLFFFFYFDDFCFCCCAKATQHSTEHCRWTLGWSWDVRHRNW